MGFIRITPLTTVGELIQLLQEVDPDRVVIISKDAEGNMYSPFSNIYTGAYEPSTPWYGEVGLDELTDEDVMDGFTEEDVMIDGTPALVICPMN